MTLLALAGESCGQLGARSLSPQEPLAEMALLATDTRLPPRDIDAVLSLIMCNPDFRACDVL